MQELKITDKVWISESAKWKACVHAYEQNNSSVFIAWFEDTQRKLQLHFTQNSHAAAQVLMYRNLHASMLLNKQFIFIEHYPLSQKEQDLFYSLGLKNVTIFSSLDEPFFQHFGGARIIDVVKKAGMQENESLENGMITKAFRNAQDKLHKKILLEQSARSQQDWLNKNIPADV